ncbi:unnamed protein product, partial [Polarella glacialis]
DGAQEEGACSQIFRSKGGSEEDAHQGGSDSSQQSRPGEARHDMNELFYCYDEDQDGQIERVEFLDAEERRLGKGDFGPRQRKESMAWLKDAGAVGTPAGGMYLSCENFKTATLKKSCELSEIGENAATAEPDKLADWIWENHMKSLAEALYGKMAEKGGTTAADISHLKNKFKQLDLNMDGLLDLSELKQVLQQGKSDMKDSDVETLFKAVNTKGSGKVSFSEFVDFCFEPPKLEAGGKIAPPSYPLAIDFKDLKKHLNEAKSFGRSVLVLSSGKDQLETFLGFQDNGLIDCKQIIGELYVGKTKTKEEWQAEAKKILMGAMTDTRGAANCRALHVRMGNSAFNWVGFCSDNSVPSDIFAGNAPKSWASSTNPGMKQLGTDSR